MAKTGKIIIGREFCKGCGLCARACPKGVIAKSGVPNSGGVFPFEAVDCAACIVCGMCYEVCPDCCITVYEKGAA